MKTNKNLRSVGEGLAGGDGGKGKKLAPEQKAKNLKRVLYQEIEEDEEIDYLSIKRREESLEDYMDDDDLDDEYDDEDEDDHFDDDDEDEDEKD